MKISDNMVDRRLILYLYVYNLSICYTFFDYSSVNWTSVTVLLQQMGFTTDNKYFIKWL